MLPWEEISKGYWLYDRAQDARYMLDAFVPARTQASTLFLLPGWWQWDLQPGNGLEIVSIEVRAVDSVITVLSDAYSIVAIEPWEPEYETAIASRLAADYDRGLYIQGLRRLTELLPEYSIVPYLRYILDRPRPDFDKIEREKIAGLREVGAVVMYDGGGRKVDALVIDERGHAAVVDDGGWLAPYMTQWQEDQRSDVAVFIKWVSERTPYGESTLGTAFCGTREGTVEDIAIALVRG